MKERKQWIVLKRKKADEGTAWKPESYFLLFIFVFIKEFSISVIQFNHGKHPYVSSYREDLEYNPERDAWPQQLEEYTCGRLNSKIQSHVFWKQTETYTLKVYSSRKKISWLQKYQVGKGGGKCF